MARPVSRFRFTFLGWHDGWYHLRLSTRRLPPLEVHAFRNTVVEWLFENDIILNELAYLANGNTVKDLGISFGMSLPVSNYSSLDFAIKAGKKGDKTLNSIEENYIKLYFGITFMDRWFVKRRFD